jgi:hypothetical protein
MLRINSTRFLLGILLASSFSLIISMESEEDFILSKEQATKLLFKSLKYGPLEIVKYVIAAGADVNKKDKWDRAPLHYAASSGYAETVRELISNGAYPNVITVRRYTPLHMAAYNGYLEATRELIAQGADVNAVNADGNTPLYVAGRLEVVRELLIYGARANLNEDWLKQDPALLLTDLEYTLIFCTLNELVSFINRREPLTQDELRHALALAAGQGRLGVVTFLVSAYNFPQSALFDALRIVKVIFTRLGILERDVHDSETRMSITQDREGYQAIYQALAAPINAQFREQLYHVSPEPVTFFDRLPTEIFTLLLSFVIDIQMRK